MFQRCTVSLSQKTMMMHTVCCVNLESMCTFGRLADTLTRSLQHNWLQHDSRAPRLSPAAPLPGGPRSRSGHPGWSWPAACRHALPPLPTRHGCAAAPPCHPCRCSRMDRSLSRRLPSAGQGNEHAAPLSHPCRCSRVSTPFSKLQVVQQQLRGSATSICTIAIKHTQAAPYQICTSTAKSWQLTSAKLRQAERRCLQPGLGESSEL